MCILSKNIDKNESKVMTYIKLFPYNIFRETFLSFLDIFH